MRTFSDLDYTVVRKNMARYWEEPRLTGEILSLECSYCDFEIKKKQVRKPRRSKSGLGRYNVMRALIVEHLHQDHRNEMLERIDADKRKGAIRQYEL